jgi:hypothetical protein
VTEAANRNRHNIARNNHFRIFPEIPNCATATEINKKITANAEELIAFANSECPDSRTAQGTTGQMTKASRNEKRRKS